MNFFLKSTLLAFVLSLANAKLQLSRLESSANLLEKLQGTRSLNDAKHRGLMMMMYYKGDYKGKGKGAVKATKAPKADYKGKGKGEDYKGKGAVKATKAPKADYKGKGKGEDYKGKGAVKAPKADYKGKGKGEDYKGKGAVKAPKADYKGKGKGEDYKGKGAVKAPKADYKGKGKGEDYKGKGKGKGSDPTLKEIVVSTDELSLLETALIAADFLEDFDSKDLDVTVFAPLDDAFKAVAEAEPVLLDALLTKEEWILHLQWLLLLHVTSGKVLAGDLSDGMEVETLTGELLTVKIDEKSVCFENEFGDAGCVVIADIMAKNGVAHAIDAVLIPYWYYFGVASLAVAVQEEVGLTKLVELVVCADLVELLDTTFGITVFAPTDDAFAGINEEICEMPDLLTKILSYHVVPKVIPSTLIGKSDSYMTLEGSDVLLASTKDGVTVNGANVVVPNVLAYNGIVHIIDEVLFPKDSSKGKGKGKGKGGDYKGKGKGGEYKGKGKGSPKAPKSYGKGKGGERF